MLLSPGPQTSFFFLRWYFESLAEASETSQVYNPPPPTPIPSPAVTVVTWAAGDSYRGNGKHGDAVKGKSPRGMWEEEK